MDFGCCVTGARVGEVDGGEVDVGPHFPGNGHGAATYAHPVLCG